HKIDVVTSASWTQEREDKYAFSQPIGRRKTILSVRVDDMRYSRGKYEDYDGMRVGLVTDSSQNDAFFAFADEMGFDYTPVFDTADKLAIALQKKEIDAILSSNLRKAENEKTLDVIDEDDFYAIVREEDEWLLDEINYAIEQMDINEGDWQNELFYRYYGPVYSSALSFTEREKDYIRRVVSQGEPITATALGDRTPYSYTEDGELKGILPDYFAEVMKLVADVMKREELPYEMPDALPYTLVVPQNKDDYQNLSDTNGVTVVIDCIGADAHKENPGRRGFNTGNYMTASMARVIRNDHKGDIKVVAVSDSQGEALVRDFLKGYEAAFTVVRYPTGEAAMRAVLDKQADVAYVYAYSAQLFVNHDTTNSVYYSMMNGMSTSFSMHVSENTDHELVTILNKCIKQISEDTLNQLASNYTSYTITINEGDVSFWQYIKAHPWIPFTVFFILALAVGVILALYLRGRWSRKLLYATEQSNKKMEEQFAIVEALSRDYTNVFAVDEEQGTARTIKLEGYATEELKKKAAETYAYADFIENYIRSRVHPDEREELIRALSLENIREKLSADDTYQGSYRIVDDGKVHHVQYTFLKIADNTHARGDFILMGFRNIDEMIRKEQEQKNVLSEALAQAQYANKAKTTFLNSMSHDIRTPMNAIIGFTSLATAHIDNKEKIRDYLGKIMTSGNHLLSLINDVLDMSRIESGKVKIEEKEVSLPEVLRDLETIAQADVKAKQLDLRIDAQGVTNETVICDKLRLNQVLLNLLSNAVKYTKSGGSVSVRVVQTADATEGYAPYTFCVKDTGIGMSREFLQHVFEPFEREQTSTVSGIQGTGLGLAITKNIVDMMGGTITVDSEQGKGSEFTVNFRFRVADSTASSQPSGQESADETDRAEQRFDGKKLLLVEDNELNQEIAQTILEDVGFTVDTADDGSVAVERMKKMPAGTYDLILMDVQMPVMNGYQATSAIRALKNRAKAATPIVAMTANAFEEDRKAAMDAGMNGFAAKPIEIDKLMKTLKDLLK
ncbi:MAG: response regulator, partial [Clostridiales bacterium]|nr:response regulator [Clostridiales bacterium]